MRAVQRYMVVPLTIVLAYPFLFGPSGARDGVVAVLGAALAGMLIMSLDLLLRGHFRPTSARITILVGAALEVMAAVAIVFLFLFRGEAMFWTLRAIIAAVLPFAVLDAVITAITLRAQTPPSPELVRERLLTALAREQAQRQRGEK